MLLKIRLLKTAVDGVDSIADLAIEDHFRSNVVMNKRQK